MKTIRNTFAVLALIATSTGCSTMMRGDLKDEQTRLYPATRSDGMMVANALSGSPVIAMASEGHSDLGNAICGGLFQFIIFGIQLPISIVTDTLCLPYDLLTREKTEENEKTDAFLDRLYPDKNDPDRKGLEELLKKEKANNRMDRTSQ